MAIWQNSLNGGTNGTAISTGNSGGTSGDAFAAVTPNVTFSNAQYNSASMSASIGGGATSNYARMAVSDRDIAYRFYVRFSVAHTGDYYLAQARLGSGTPTTYTVLVNAANQMRVRNQTSGVNIWTAAASFPLNQWVRVEVIQHQGTTTSNGQLRVAYYVGASTTPIELSPWITGQDLGGATGVTTQVLFGKVSASAYSGTAFIDDIEVRSGTDFVDWTIQNTAPVVHAGVDQFVQSGDSVSLSASVTDPDAGESHTYAWVFLWPSSGAPALTGGTSATPSFTAGSEGSVYALQVTVNDGDATDTDTVNIAVTPPLGGSPNMMIWDGAVWA